MQKFLVLAVALLALAAVGCGDDDDGADTGGAGSAGISGSGGGGGSGGEGGSSGPGGEVAGSIGSQGGTGGTVDDGTGGRSVSGSGGNDGGTGSEPTSGTGGGGAGGSGGTGGSGGAGGSGGTGGSGGAGGSGGTGGSPPEECMNPVFVTSDPNGGWSDGGYYVHNNMWNSAAGLGPETLYACSYHNWYVVSDQTNNAGAVKTYPNVHQDYDNVPISSFNTITSTFAANSPHFGIYNVAYDIWINGVATPGCTEIMIWTENYNQVPAGSQQTTATLGGRTYDVWKTSDNGYIAFVPTVVFTSGTVDLLEIFNWTTSMGWLPANATLGQICFGVEIVSTDGAEATFEFTDFSIAAN